MRGRTINKFQKFIQDTQKLGANASLNFFSEGYEKEVTNLLKEFARFVRDSRADLEDKFHCKVRWFDLVHKPATILAERSGLWHADAGFFREPWAPESEEAKLARNWFEGKGFSGVVGRVISSDEPADVVVYFKAKNRRAIESGSETYRRTIDITEGVEAAHAFLYNVNAKDIDEEKLNQATKNGKVSKAARKLLKGLEMEDFQKNREGAECYIVLAAVYEKDIVVGDEGGFYYLYLPCLTGRQDAASMTVVGITEENDGGSIDFSGLMESLTLWSRYMNQAELERVSKYHSRRSASAAILSRNMSHNIGSHVTPRTNLDDLKRRVKRLLVKEDWWDGSDWNRKVYPIIEELKDKLDEYIQRKAEFIAEFSTDPLISNRGAWFFQDVIAPLVANTALIDTLAANEGYTYDDYKTPRLVIRCWREENQLQALYRSDWIDDQSLDWPQTMQGAPYAMRHEDFTTQGLYGEVMVGDDLRVTLPGPVGDMAVYSILENIIRNAAKHGSKDRGSIESRDPLEVDVRISEYEDKGKESLCKVEIWENLSNPEEKVPDPEAKTSEIELYKKIQYFLKKDVIDSRGELRKEAWGTAEMVLCANLLQEYIPGAMIDPPSLKVSCKVAPVSSDRSAERCNRLIYEFAIPKARTAIFFGWDEDGAFEARQSILASEGFLRLPLTDLTDAATPPLPACDFAVIDARGLAPDDLQKIPAARNRLPFRVILIGKPESGVEAVRTWLERVAGSDGPPPIQSTDELAPWLWKTWIAHLRESSADGAPVSIDLYLQQQITARPTNRWIELAKTHNERTQSAGGDEKEAVPLRVWAHGKENQIECAAKTGKTRQAERCVVVDRHGNLVQGPGVGTGPLDRTIVIDKSSADFDVLFNPPRSEQGTMPYELAEAGLLRVLVIDERIAQKALDPFQEMGADKEAFRRAFTGDPRVHASVWHAARKAGIYVATHLVLEPPPEDGKNIFTVATHNWTDERPTNGSFASVGISTRPSNAVTEITLSSHDDENVVFDLVVIHQTVVDHLNDRHRGSGDRLLNALADKYWLVIESGRGIPPEVSTSDHKFLTFSAIERAFRHGRVAKLNLTRTVMTAKRHMSRGPSS